MMSRSTLLSLIVLILALAACSDQMSMLQEKRTPVPTLTALPTKTPPATALPPSVTSTVKATIEATATELPPTETVAPTVEVTFTATITATEIPPTATITATVTAPPVTPTEVAGVEPHEDADPCPHPDNEVYHALWDAEQDCHYDHEHGTNPFTGEVVAAFPGFDLFALLGGVGVGHTNPSSPMENTHKHEGFKWNVQLEHLEGCTPFEGAVHGANGSVIQYHAFGDYSVEYQSGIHSLAGMVRFCDPDDPTDYGYMYVVQHVNYGQRIVPYQGTLLPYPNTPDPPYLTPLGPYASVDCVTTPPATVIQCRGSATESGLDFIRRLNLRTNSTWTTKPAGVRTPGSPLFQLLFRVADTPQVIQWGEHTEYPFTFRWVCSGDGGVTFDPTRCRYTNSTTQVHEIAGIIPAAWDNLAGFDTDPEPGRITAEGYVTHYGDLNPECIETGVDCHPIKLQRAFVGFWGSVLVNTENKLPPNIVPYLPSRNIWFCNGQVCAATDTGAVPSGWIGSEN